MLFSESLRQIVAVLADAQFHSGTELAGHLHISRSAVQKQIQTLSQFGLEINAVSGKGYRLQRPISLLDEMLIQGAMGDRAVSCLHSLQIFDQLDSTNDYLNQRPSHDDYGKVAVCLAEYQTAGRGRRGRQWVSPFGSNIYLSLSCHYDDSPSQLSGLSLAVGVAVIKSLKQVGLTGIGLKWPNDIFWQDKKLGGILIEVAGEAEGPCRAVIGLGLNGYLSGQQAQPIEQAWIDLDSIMQQSTHALRNQLVGILLDQLLPLIADYMQNGFAHYIDDWRSFDCMRDRPVTVHMGNQVQPGIVRGIDDDGLLLFENHAGQINTYASGELSLRMYD